MKIEQDFTNGYSEIESLCSGSFQSKFSPTGITINSRLSWTLEMYRQCSTYPSILSNSSKILFVPLYIVIERSAYIAHFDGITIRSFVVHTIADYYGAYTLSRTSR